MRLLLKPEAELLFDWMLTEKEKEDGERTLAETKKVFAQYLATPLSDVQPPLDTDPREAALRIAECLKKAKAML
jgi:hypothetical protein